MALTETEKKLARVACEEAFQRDITGTFTSLALNLSLAATDDERQAAVQKAERGVATSAELLRRMLKIVDGG
jgi:hypothetical protein